MNDYQEEGGGGGEDEMAVATGDSNYSLTEAEFRAASVLSLDLERQSCYRAEASN